MSGMAPDAAYYGTSVYPAYDADVVLAQRLMELQIELSQIRKEIDQLRRACGLVVLRKGSDDGTADDD